MEDAKTFINIVHHVILETWEYFWGNPAMDPPPCYVSTNENGTVNFSYPKSCFYTINNHGVVTCKEIPGESLDLNEIKNLEKVCATIFNDMTGNSRTDKVVEMTNKAIGKVFQ